MTQNLYIGFDLGTTNIKAVLVDDSLSVLSATKREMNYIEPESGYKETDPEILMESIFDILKEFTSLIKNKTKIKAVCFSGATGNTMLLDEANNPLTNIISWLDTRPVKSLFTVEEVYPVTGWPAVEIFPLAHLSWWKENAKEIYEKAQRIVMNNDFITFRLTGNFALDYSTATTSHLYNQLDKCWHKPFLDKLEIKEEQLSKLLPTGTPIGNITKFAAEQTGLSEDVIVISGAFDHPTAARAVGIKEEGDLLLSCGTSWVGFFPTKDREKALKLKVLVDPYLSDETGHWGAIFSLPKLGIKIDNWINKLAEYYKIPEKEKFDFFNCEAGKSKLSDNGLIINIEDEPSDEIFKTNSAVDVARIIMESVARKLKDEIDKINTGGITTKKIFMVGGPTNSDIWIKIISKITGLKINLGDGEYTGAIGAAKIAKIK